MLGAGVLVLSVVVVFLELLGMRLLSFMLWHHLAYMALSVAMLGFGASGAWLEAFLRKRDPFTSIAFSATLLGLTSVAGFVLLTRVGLDTFEMGWPKILKLGLYYAVLVVPYFFAALGLGFMFVEIGLMQKLVLFLGHPAGSISVTLASMLAGSGLGSLLAGRRGRPVPIKLAAAGAAVAALLLVYAFALGPIESALLGLPLTVRQIVAAGLVGLIAIPMGMPFPLALERVSALGPAAVPWAWGMNGGAAGLGSILCICGAMSAGFRAVLVVAAGFYVVAIVLLVPLVRGEVQRETVSS